MMWQKEAEDIWKSFFQIQYAYGNHELIAAAVNNTKPKQQQVNQQSAGNESLFNVKLGVTDFGKWEGSILSQVANGDSKLMVQIKLNNKKIRIIKTNGNLHG